MCSLRTNPHSRETNRSILLGASLPRNDVRERRRYGPSTDATRRRIRVCPGLGRFRRRGSGSRRQANRLTRTKSKRFQIGAGALRNRCFKLLAAYSENRTRFGIPTTQKSALPLEKILLIVSVVGVPCARSTYCSKERHAMSFQRSFVMGLVVFATLALSGRDDARARTRWGRRRTLGQADARRRGADARAAREARGRVGSAGARGAHRRRSDVRSDDPLERRAGRAAPRSIACSSSRRRKPRARRRRRWRRSARCSGRIRSRIDPHKLIPVRQEDRELLAAYDRKGQRRGARVAQAREPRDSEARALRAEIEAARAEAEAVRAENARLRERAETMSGIGASASPTTTRAPRCACAGAPAADPAAAIATKRDADRAQVATAPARQRERTRRREAPPPAAPADDARRSRRPRTASIITPLPIASAAPSSKPGPALAHRRVRRVASRCGARYWAGPAPSAAGRARCRACSVACSRWKPALVAASWASDSSMPLPTPVR